MFAAYKLAWPKNSLQFHLYLFAQWTLRRSWSYGMIVQVWKGKSLGQRQILSRIQLIWNEAETDRWFKRKCLTEDCLLYSIATCPPWLPGDSCTNYRKTSWVEEENYVNLHWLRILLEPLGILINKNKPEIFLYWKAIKRWNIICCSLRKEIQISQNNIY